MMAGSAKDSHKSLDTPLIKIKASLSDSLLMMNAAQKCFFMIYETKLDKMIYCPLDSLLECLPLEPSLCSSPDLYLLSDFPKSFTFPTFSSHKAGPHVDIPPSHIPAGSQNQRADLWVSKQICTWFYHPVFECLQLVLHGTEVRYPHWALPKW